MTVEPQTALGSFIKNKKQPAMNESQSADQFLLLTEILIESGFEHYEISNFARREMYSKHNTNYWRGVSYLGIGPSAHSFNGNTRAWNISNNARYIESISRKAIPAELETLTIANKINEYILTSLRTMWGTDLTKLTQDFGASYRIDVESATKRVLEKGLISRENDIITLTLSGKLLADQIAAELFVD
jgi:oxygen-independent coproporphyrinogen-3 oxidase